MSNKCSGVTVGLKCLHAESQLATKSYCFAMSYDVEIVSGVNQHFD